MMADRHWLLQGNKIVVEIGDGSYSVVATVKNDRAVRQMLRYTELAQDVEAVLDRAMMTGAPFTSDFDKILRLVEDTVDDTMNRSKVPCPEVDK